MKHFLSLADISTERFDSLLNRAAEMKKQKTGFEEALSRKAVGLIFFQKSTRTRVSFETGISRLGGTSLYFSSNDLKLSSGEPIRDTARVLSRYLSALVIRTFDHNDLIEMKKYSSIPIINAMTDLDHPCQGLADILTIRENFAKEHVRIAFMGGGHNIAIPLMFGAAHSGMDFVSVLPKKYQVPETIVAEARKLANGRCTIETTDDVAAGLRGANVVSTDIWVSPGQEDAQERMNAFKGFQVNTDLMRLAANDAIFMHCLPAHRGEEVTDEVMESEQSKVWDEAENRMWAQMALLEMLCKD